MRCPLGDETIYHTWAGGKGEMLTCIPLGSPSLSAATHQLSPSTVPWHSSQSLPVYLECTPSVHLPCGIMLVGAS